MINRRRLTIGALSSAGAAVLVFGLSGCAGLGFGGASPTDAAAPESPLAKYYTALYGGQDQSDLDRQNAAVEEAVSACMQEQGFDYQPSKHGGSFVVADDSGLDWASEEFATTYGYGITTDPLGMDADSHSEADQVDPNADYVASLSDTERAAYNEALWGPTPDEPAEGESAAYDWTKGGCNGRAQHDFGGPVGADDPEFADVIDQMNGVYDQVLESPAVVAKEKVWADCMADAGYDGFTHKNDAPTAISDAYSALFTPPGSDGETSPPSSAPEADPAALKALQQRELAQATVDFGCARDSGYADTLVSEQFRIEQAFVDGHRQQLDALVARYGADSE